MTFSATVAKVVRVRREDILRLVEQGRLAEARSAFEAALARDPDDVELLADAADVLVGALQQDEPDRGALARGVELARRGARLAARTGDRAREADFGLLEAAGLSQLGDPSAALARLDEVLAIDPDLLDARGERAWALFELCRLDEARSELHEVLRADPDDAWAHHVLGLVAEREGDRREAERRFARARRLSPEEFPRAVTLGAEGFDRAVEAALEELPEPVRRWLENVAIAVEDVPADDDLLASDPPHSPTILGLFRGSPLGDKASQDPWSHFPSSIVLYQKNLERLARDREELIEEIRVTLLHEVGHFLGLDEDELERRGLD